MIPRRLTTTKTLHGKGNSHFSVYIVIIPTRLLCPMNESELFWSLISINHIQVKRMNFVIACLRPSQSTKLGIFTGSRAVYGKEMYKKV